MKHHVLVKFFAILLCAAMLLCAVGSVFGLFALTELGLYSRSFNEAYEEYLENQALGFAYTVGERYASMNLGGCSTQLVDQYYGTYFYHSYFLWDRVSYSLLDGEGTVLVSNEMDEEYSPAYTFEFPAGNYMELVSLSPVSLYSTESSEERVRLMTVTTAPYSEATVGQITVAYGDGSSQSIYTGGALGSLYPSGDRQIRFISGDHIEPLDMGADRVPVSIRIWDTTNKLIYEATCPAGVVDLYRYGQTTELLLPDAAGRGATDDPIVYNNGDYRVYNAIPNEGASPAFLSVTYSDGSSESVGNPGSIGSLIRDYTGVVSFYSQDPYLLEPREGVHLTEIVFGDADNNALYEASCETGAVGTLEYDSNGLMTFRAVYIPAQGGDSATLATVPATTWPADVSTSPTADPTPVTDATVPETTGEAVSEGDVNVFSQPSTTSEVVSTLTAGQEIVILQQQNVDGVDWGLCQQGWIRMEDVTLTGAAATAQVRTASEEEPETAEASEEPQATEYVETVPTEPVVTASADVPEIHAFTYYDSELGQSMVAQYVWRYSPDYTVRVELAPGASNYEYEWELLRAAYDLRGQLLPLLGISLLVFALGMVYLCCAAGRKPGSSEIRAGGLNRIPLDLYGVGAFFGVCGLILVGMGGAQYLVRSNTQIMLLFLLALGYAGSLLIVAFLFALAAQAKTPGAFLWRNTLCGWCIRLLVLCWHGLMRGAPALKGLFRGLWQLVTGLFRFLKKILLWFWQTGKKLFSRLGRTLSRFFSLLPLTWQWLVTGFFLVIVLILGIDAFKDGHNDLLFPLALLITFGILLYAAHCFGTLLEGIKRMNKGDLDSKVEDKLMVGSFRDFAGELNNLAGVVTVAAQKQLKSERMKTELITNVSHDIKTPLTSIINYVDLLEKPHTPQEQEVYLEVLSRQSLRLKKLIDDLMEMSKASTGNLAVEITKVNAVEAVNQALGEFADKLEKAQLIPVFRQPEEAMEIMADGRLVWRVLSNLLSNAVKYALPGTRIYLDIIQLEGKVIISMKNISREELNVNADELLERFVRGDASRNTEGSGLGLNIAQSLMELQKGQLQLLVDGDLFKVTLIFPGA